MEIQKNVWIAVALAVLCIITAGCTSPTGKVTVQDEVKIGFIGPLAGELAIYGIPQQRAIMMATEEVNRAGGVNGKRVRVMFEDGQCIPEPAIRAARKLIMINGVRFIIGPTCSSPTLAVAPIVEENGVITISPVAGSDDVSTAGDYIFRTIYSNRLLTRAGVEYLNRIDNPSIALLVINNDFGNNMAERIVKEYQGEVVVNEMYDSEESDFRSILLRIREANPELIYLIGYHVDGARILRQARELGIATPFFGGGDPYDNPEFVELAGAAGEGFRFVSGPTEARNNFNKKYAERFGEEPVIFAAYAYDAFYLITNGIEYCGAPDPDCVKDYLYAVKYDGVSNHITFDESGDLENARIVLKEVREGEIVEVSER